MRTISALAAALLLAFAVAGLSACEKKGPAERAGEAVDKAAKDTGDAVKEAGDKIKDATK
jgi:hyperosmotically inducible protein